MFKCRFCRFARRAGLLLAGAMLLGAPCARGDEAGDRFFQGKRPMMTAVWAAPFGYEEIKSNHAPRGPFLGNGDVGVVAYTAAGEQTLRISKVDFVTDGWSDWAGSGPAALPVGEVRVAVGAPPAGGFRYEMDELAAELRMTTGTAQQVAMTTWMGAEENYVVIELENLSAGELPVVVETSALDALPAYTASVGIRKDVAQATRRTKTGDSVRWVSSAGISTRVVGVAAQWERASGAKARTTFALPPGRPLYVVTYVSGGGTDDNARLREAYRKLKSQSGRRLLSLKKRKQEWWKDMWTRSYVETHDSLLDRHYLSSVYLLASAYNRRSPACGGMYGVWNMEDEMMYHGDIHLNYNSQAGFYSVFSANRPELALPFFDFIERVVPEGRRRAREDMGSMHPSWQGKACRGLLFPVSALGIGCFYGSYWQQTMNAPFNVPLFSWYYEYTGDEDFLRRRAYPFIRECGDFYEDYMRKEPFGDSYRYTITTGGHENSWDLNPPSDLGFVEQTFSLLLRYSELLGVDADRRALWRDILAHLPEYKIVRPTKQPNQGLPVYAKNEAGWDWPAHVIQLHPVYPCEVLTLHSDSTARQIARNTLYYYGVSQRGFTETMNELGLSAFVMGARLGFSPEILAENLRTLIRRAGANFLIADGHHCLEKTAAVETINSMMLQSVDGILHLFPCWLPEPASFTRLRAKGAFLVTAAYDGKAVTSLTVESEMGKPCRLWNPWPGKRVRATENGRPVPVSQTGGLVEFATEKGKRYEVSFD